MLPKNLRLKKNSAFKATYNVRNTSSDALFIVFAGKKKTDTTKPSRFGFVVSKKNHKRAVKRNRLKRLMRESCRVMLKEGLSDDLEFMSLVVVARDKAIGKSYKEVKDSLAKLISRLKKKH